MDHDAINAAVERLNHGEPAAAIDPALIKRWWEVARTIPADLRNNTAIGFNAITGSGELTDLIPEQFAGMMMRFALLNALVERGFFNDYLDDETRQGMLFRALAIVPCNNQDFVEVMSPLILRQATAEDAEVFRQKMFAAGGDCDHPMFVDKVLAFMCEQSK